jgi:hypothetical protein
MTGQLALLALVGDLVIAIDAAAVVQLRLATDIAARRVDRNLFAVELDAETIPGWDVGERLGLGTWDTAWGIVSLPSVDGGRRFGVRIGRCAAVQKLPVCHPIPSSLFRARAGAIAAAFAGPQIAELMSAPSGVVLDLSRLLTAGELGAGERLRRRREAGIDRVT